VHGVEFLERVDPWVPPEAETVYAILDNRNGHRATDVLWFSLAHPPWEFVFQPPSAAALNLIEPWGNGLRSLALKGRRLETWEHVWQAMEAATAYWKAHRPPCVRGPSSPPSVPAAGRHRCCTKSSIDLSDAPLSLTFLALRH